MHRTLIDVSTTVAASAIMLIVVVAGARLTIPTEPPSTGTEISVTTSCLKRLLIPTGDTPLHATATLCLRDGGILSTVEIASLPTGTVYTAWLAHLEQPRFRQGGQCAIAQHAAQAGATMPGRIDSGTVDQAGRIVLSSELPAMRFASNTEIEMLVVDHGEPVTPSGPVGLRPPIAWDPSWYSQPSTLVAPGQSPGRLVGCAAFWLRGGAELSEH